MKRSLYFSTSLLIAVSALFYTNQLPKEKYVNIIRKVMPTVVSLNLVVEMQDPITEEYRNVRIGGSGVFISSNGYILTCKHVVNFPGVEYATVEMFNGEVVAARIVTMSKKCDLALLKIDYPVNVEYVKLADPRKLEVGQEVIAIGSPLGLTFSASDGIISGLNRDFPFARNTTQSDTALNPGNSGGPLFNLKGELVGINSFMILVVEDTPIFSGLGFSVQSGQCLEFLTDCGKRYPKLRRNKWLNVLDVFLERKDTKSFIQHLQRLKKKLMTFGQTQLRLN